MMLSTAGVSLPPCPSSVLCQAVGSLWWWRRFQ
ncbi:hypothetical protein A2U01_0092352, partial [Trifolium medium]|nr:hypothetical protein [Trifolium medium]